MISGVCTGLEACGKGATGTWRAAFALGSFFLFFPFVAYICMALFVPLVKTKKDAEEANGSLDAGRVNFFGSAPPKAPDPEEELQKLADMKAKGLIDEDEYKQLRKKALGL